MHNVQKFLTKYRTKNFAKGEVILNQDEVPTTAYVIKTGVVKTYNLTTDGEEKPISFDVKGEAFPLGWIFSKLDRTQYFYGAFTDCELYCVPLDEYLGFIKSNTDTLFAALDNLINRYLNYQMRVNALEQSKASSKVLYTVHFLSLRFGVDLKKDVVRIPLPLTQQDLANFMGLTRETTSMELKKLQKQRVISYRNQKYTIRTDKLNQRLDEEYDQAGLRYKLEPSEAPEPMNLLYTSWCFSLRQRRACKRRALSCQSLLRLS